MKIDDLAAYTDSQVVVKQVSGEYEAKDSQMIRYLERAKSLISKLQRFTLSRIPRENSKADSLSRLSSIDLIESKNNVH